MFLMDILVHLNKTLTRLKPHFGLITRKKKKNCSNGKFSQFQMFHIRCVSAKRALLYGGEQPSHHFQQSHDCVIQLNICIHIYASFVIDERV